MKAISHKSLIFIKAIGLVIAAKTPRLGYLAVFTILPVCMGMDMAWADVDVIKNIDIGVTVTCPISRGDIRSIRPLGDLKPGQKLPTIADISDNDLHTMIWFRLLDGNAILTSFGGANYTGLVGGTNGNQVIYNMQMHLLHVQIGVPNSPQFGSISRADKLGESAKPDGWWIKAVLYKAVNNVDSVIEVNTPVPRLNCWKSNAEPPKIPVFNLMKSTFMYCPLKKSQIMPGSTVPSDISEDALRNLVWLKKSARTTNGMFDIETSFGKLTVDPGKSNSPLRLGDSNYVVYRYFQFDGALLNYLGAGYNNLVGLSLGNWATNLKMSSDADKGIVGFEKYKEIGYSFWQYQDDGTWYIEGVINANNKTAPRAFVRADRVKCLIDAIYSADEDSEFQSPAGNLDDRPFNVKTDTDMVCPITKDQITIIADAALKEDLNLNDLVKVHYNPNAQKFATSFGEVQYSSDNYRLRISSESELSYIMGMTDKEVAKNPKVQEFSKIKNAAASKPNLSFALYYLPSKKTWTVMGFLDAVNLLDLPYAYVDARGVKCYVKIPDEAGKKEKSRTETKDEQNP